MSDKNLSDSMRKALPVRDTGPAKLPALPVLRSGNAQVDEWARKVSEIVRVQAGAAGNPWEKVVTLRDIKDVSMMAAVLQAQPKDAKPGDMVINIGGGLTASVAVDAFAEAIKQTKLYKDLMKRLDDPSRFDDLPAEVRRIVSKSIADEALIRGTAIEEIRVTQQSLERAVAMWGRELTAAVTDASAGVRNLEWAVAERDFAQAGKITQLEASLGNYYQDGTPGRAILESQMTATADRVQGLSGQITFKIQAGGALAGWGLAASENTAGDKTSAFIVTADKFAVVRPSYSPPYRPVYELDANGNVVYEGGSPKVAYNQVLVDDIPLNQGGIPFGIDANGMYINTNVYMKGAMRIDSPTGKTLADGMRGSVDIGTVGSSWSDITARQAVWSAIGKSGTATNNNHLVIGDQVMISNTAGTFSASRMWNGSGWINPGAVINGDMVVNGSLSASKINTNGLAIRDNSGNVIFSFGVPLNVSRISGLGALATQDFTWLGNLRWSNNTIVQEGQLASVHNPIRPENVASFLSGAIIDTAYIKYGAVETLQVAGGSITSMMYGVGTDKTISGADAVAYVDITMPALSSGVVITGITSVTSTDPTPPAAGWAHMEIIRREGNVRIGNVIRVAGKTFDPMTSVICVRDPSPPVGTVRYYLNMTIIPNYNSEYKPLIFRNNMVTAIGGKR